MESISYELIASAIAQLGVAGIFVWLFIRKDKDKDDLARRKDEEKDKLVGQLIESYNENTRVQSEVKASIEENTRTNKETQTLTQKVYEELIKNGNN